MTTTGMQNRRFVIDTIEDEALDELTRADEARAIGMLNVGTSRDNVFDWLVTRNTELLR